LHGTQFRKTLQKKFDFPEIFFLFRSAIALVLEDGAALALLPNTKGKRAVKRHAEKCLIIGAISARDMRGEMGRLIP
jgi:hypothetical protein